MTPSDSRRLHPLSFLFQVGGQFRQLVFPVLLVLLGAGSAGMDWQPSLALLFIPYAIFALVQSLSFRYRYAPHELVISRGFIFRKERHIPYDRIQNIDAVQNLAHRLLGVVEVRVETGGGDELEARMRVLPIAGLEEMRARVFAGRQPADATVAGDAAPVPQRETLLALGPRDLLLAGFVDSRGMVIVGAVFGLLYEVGLFDPAMNLIFGEKAGGRGIARQVMRSLFGGGIPPIGRLLFMIAAFAVVLIVIRLLSMGWSLIRLYGFRLDRIGDDLRAEFGLITRVMATIPLRRIQTLTVREGPLHRLSGTASVRVDSAGGEGPRGAEVKRESLAPIVRRPSLSRLLRSVLPEVEIERAVWHPVDPRGVRRAFISSLAILIFFALPFAQRLRWWWFALLPVLAIWAYVHARLHVKNLGWALVGSEASSGEPAAILFRSGWLWRHLSVARFSKMQAIGLHESPFDRRNRMGRVRVDTAGAGDLSHRVDIPYLSIETARQLHRTLSAAAARTAFRW